MDEYNEILQLLINEKGGTRQDYRLLMDMVGYLESHNITDRKQIEGGPGRGYFQYEMNQRRGKQASSKTAANRTIALYKKYGKELPKWLKNTIKAKDVDFSNLSLNKQKILFLGDKEGRNPNAFSDLWKGKTSIEEFYLNDHWAGKTADKAGKRKYFRKGIKEFKDSIKDTNYNNRFNKSVNIYNKQIDIPNFITEPFSPKERLLQDVQDYQPVDRRSYSEAMSDFTEMPTKQEIQQEPVEQKIDMNLNQYLQTQPLQKNELAMGGAVSGEEDEMLNSYNEGGSHRSNPLGGIPIGTGSNGKPNLVEEGESSFESDEGKYIFSNAIKI